MNQVKLHYDVDIIIASWDKKVKDFKLCLIEHKNNNPKEYKLISDIVKVEEKETALLATKRILKDEMRIENIKMTRHIAVFDNPNRKSSDNIISNVMLVIVEDLNKMDTKGNEKLQILNLQEIAKVNLAYDYEELIHKFKDIMEYDIYSQIFDTEKFGSKFIVSLLGDSFSISELMNLARWAKRKENKTTFYRRVDSNLQKYIKKNK